MSFIRELQKRNVFRVAAAYTVVAWLLIQVGATLEPAMHLPDWVDSVLAFFLLLGFPLAMFFAWAYELTPEGIKRDVDVGSNTAVRALAGRKWDRLIIFVLVLALGYFVIDKYLLDQAASIPETAGTGVTPVDAVEPKGVASARTAVSSNSIAVLPFVNMSSDPEQEYFSDGLTEELLNLLAGIDELKVAARTSSFFYKDKLDTITLTEIARQLEVAHVLEGSVRRSGDTIRITAQLIQADGGFHLWSQTYDRTLSDIFAIQDEISAAVVDALKVTLLGETPHASVINTESWELTQQARFLYNRRGPGEMQQALELFQRAAELDANNAAAWLGMAPLYFYLFDPPKLDDAFNAAQKAVDLDPENPEAAARFAQALWLKGRHEEAGQFARRAVELGAHNPLILSMRAGSRNARGNYDEAIRLQRQAVSLDPLSITGIGNLASYLVGAGRWDEAEPWAQKALELAPDVSANHRTLAEIRLFQGRAEEAFTHWSKYDPSAAGMDLFPSEDYVLEGAIRFSRGQELASREILESLETQFTGDFPVHMAWLRAWRGEYDQAFGYLEQAIELYPEMGNNYLLHPYLYALREDPRWKSIQAFIEKPRPDPNIF